MKIGLLNALFVAAELIVVVLFGLSGGGNSAFAGVFLMLSIALLIGWPIALMAFILRSLSEAIAISLSIWFLNLLLMKLVAAASSVTLG